MGGGAASGRPPDAPAGDQPEGRSRSRLPGSLSDTLAGLVFIGFGLSFAAAAIHSYDIGTPAQMGPGFFPMVLGGLLLVLGIAVVVKGFVAAEQTLVGRIPWRAVVLIIGAVMFFGATVRGLGLVPALVATVLVSGFAGKRTGVIAPTIIAVGLTLLSILIFVVLLRLRLPLFGPWLGA